MSGKELKKNTAAPTLLWWGRSDADYSRNRILLQVLADLGWKVEFFRPWFSRFGDVEAALSGRKRPDLVWVPCFRQRDVAAAARYCKRMAVPLVADPLISAYDKQVFERRKFSACSRRGRRLLAQESQLLSRADYVLADTEAHAVFFRDVLKVAGDRIAVVPVAAEETLFRPGERSEKLHGEPLEVLFFGSFIPLQGPQVIVDAARCYQGPPLSWCLLGDGPLLAECQERAAGLANVAFEKWIPYSQLPARIARADILLGIFGSTLKAARVVPNKVYQAAACGRPVVTLRSGAYPAELLSREDSGFRWVPAGDAAALAAAVAALASDRGKLALYGVAARDSYEKYLSMAQVRRQLAAVLINFGITLDEPANG